MFKKKIINILVVVIAVTMLTSCAYISSLTKGKSTKIEQKVRAEINKIDNKINNNISEKLDIIAGLSFGTDYALNKVLNPSKEVQVAIDINRRVSSIAGNPTVEKMKDMQDTIDKLTSVLATERTIGIQKLNEKDSSIIALQDESKVLISEKDSEIHKYMLNAASTAEQSDIIQGELNKMDHWGGLGAIFYGFKRLIVRMAWIIGGFSILFLILRLLSASNPICGAIFGVFEQIASWVINMIKVAFPKALNFAGNVSKEVYSSCHNLLGKIVDNIENLKQIEKKLGHDITLKELLVELDKSMDDSEKKVINAIKTNLGY